MDVSRRVSIYDSVQKTSYDGANSIQATCGLGLNGPVVDILTCNKGNWTRVVNGRTSSDCFYVFGMYSHFQLLCYSNLLNTLKINF